MSVSKKFAWAKHFLKKSAWLKPFFEQKIILFGMFINSKNNQFCNNLLFYMRVDFKYNYFFFINRIGWIQYRFLILPNEYVLGSSKISAWALLWIRKSCFSKILAWAKHFCLGLLEQNSCLNAFVNTGPDVGGLHLYRLIDPALSFP